MADDEQFSLCWNNFNSNLSAGFHESLCRGDLVDVTLAAEGQFVKAHRLVLSVCSPYFRKMFTQMPANQHAFVFLKDVSHTALKDLIQFMYCGEVNVKQEALPAFISTAEALQIKGLTDSDPPQSQTPPEPSTPTPQIQQQQQIQTSPRVRQRTSTARSYKIETVEDSGDDAKQTTQIVIQTTAPTHPPQATITTQPQHQQQQQHQPQQQQQQHHHQPQQQQHITQQTLHTQTHQLTSVSMPAATTTTVVTQKRPAQRSSLGSVPNIKRSKSTIDPLEASDANTAAATHQINVQTVVAESKPQVQHHHQQQQQHQTHHHHQQQQAQHQQQTNEPEYIDLPIDLPTKSEPDYAEEAGEVDQAEQDATYVEDESYGDMRYDESYFTENEDAAAAGGNATATSTQNTSATTATTSKAIVKQQPLSDSSYMDTSADPANSDAQAEEKLQQLLEESAGNRIIRKYVKASPQNEFPSMDKIIEAISAQRGLTPKYESSKGTMELSLEGQIYRYVSRKGKFSIYRCSNQLKKKECLARVVMYKNLAYHLNDKHSHKIPTKRVPSTITSSTRNVPMHKPPKMVKSATAVAPKKELSVNLLQKQQPAKPGKYVTSHQQPLDDKSPKDLIEAKDTTSNVVDEKSIPDYLQMKIKEENDESLEFTAEVPANTSILDDPNAFREKIKERLQRRLIRKIKKTSKVVDL